MKLALFLSTLSGIAALGHQMVWVRRLTDLSGIAGDSLALTLGCFFFGLALGALIVDRLGLHLRRPWRALGFCQLSIGILALPLLYLPSWSQNLGTIFGLKTISFLSLLPPAIIIGTILPLLARATLNKQYQMQGTGIWIYALNIFGGVIGILVTIITLPWLGVLGTGWMIVGINLLASAVCFWREKKTEVIARLIKKKVVGAVVTPWWSRILIVAMLSGLLVIGMEVIVTHQFSQVLLNSFHSAAIMLTLVLLSLVAGTALSVKFRECCKGNYRKALPLALWLSALSVAAEPFLLIGISHRLQILTFGQGIGAYIGGMLRIGAVSIIPLFTVTGMVFPLLFSWASEELNDPTGRRWGMLLFLNGLGGVLGAELAQALIMPHFGLWYSMLFFALIYALLAIFIIGRGKKRVVSKYLIPTVSVLTIASLMLPLLKNLPSQAPLPPGDRVLEIASGREGMVATVRDRNGYLRILLNNSYIVGGTRSLKLERMEMHLPLMLHPNPQVVGMLGIGAGLTADAALDHGVVKKLESVEISPLIIRMAKKYFSPFLSGLFTDPRSKVISGDGRIYFMTCQKRFDVIVADLFLPYRSGVGRLYTLEHFAAIKNALKEGGLFCQWLPLYQMTEEQVASIIRTFQQVFPEGEMMRNSMGLQFPTLGLLGYKNRQKPLWEIIKLRSGQVCQEGRIKNVFLRHSEGVVMHLLGPINWHSLATRARLNTMNNMLIEQEASFRLLTTGWQSLSGDGWWTYSEACLGRLATEESWSAERVSAVKAAQSWLKAQKEALSGDSPRLRFLTEEAICLLPPAMTKDPLFNWRDLLIDVPLKLYGQRGLQFTDTVQDNG